MVQHHLKLEELEEFKEKYPDVFQVVETVAGVQSEAKIAKLRQDLESVKQREKSLEKEKLLKNFLDCILISTILKQMKSF